jgi:DeoR family transcriptional regulator of aga operon
MNRTNETDTQQLGALERQLAILQWVNTKGKASVHELSRHFGVSEVTIRLDLTLLDEKSLLVRSRGGALVNNTVMRELTLREKHGEHAALKRKLGQAVAGLISNGERIILDSGTTTEEVAIALRNHQDLVVMTNGLNVANQLALAEGIEVMVAGGMLRRKSMSFHGTAAEIGLQHLHFDKVVLGVDGFDLKLGLTTHFEAEASLNRLMCEVSEQIIVATDSSKFQRRGFHAICAIREIDVLVTDSGIPVEYSERLEHLGTKVIIIE